MEKIREVPADVTGDELDDEALAHIAGGAGASVARVNTPGETGWAAIEHAPAGIQAGHVVVSAPVSIVTVPSHVDPSAPTGAQHSDVASAALIPSHTVGHQGAVHAGHDGGAASEAGQKQVEGQAGQSAAAALAEALAATEAALKLAAEVTASEHGAGSVGHMTRTP